MKLTTPGTTVSRTFAIARDERVKNITDAELQKQYQFAREIQEKFTLTNDIVVRIRRIKADIADRSAQAQESRGNCRSRAVNGSADRN